MSIRRYAWWSTGIGSFCLASGCMMPKTPGELVGAYHIDGALTVNTCGSTALPAPDHLSFDVEIRQNKGEGLWVRQAPPPHSGSLDADGHFAFQFASSYAIQGMAKDATEAAIELDPAKAADPTLIERADQNAMKQCQLTVNESVQGTLLRSLQNDAGAGSSDSASASDLVANNEIAIRAAAGSDCGVVLAAQSGPFDQLPCHAHYDLTGELATK